MKVLGGLLLILALAVTMLPGRSVHAAACSNISSFGSVTLDIPTLPTPENRALWIRLEAPSPSAHVLVQVNESQCIQIGGHDQIPGQWSWQTYRVQQAVQPVVFEQASGNTIKIIGVNEGIKVDRVVVTETTCVPQDFGANCQQVQAVQDSLSDKVLPPPSSQPVRGEVLLSSTPEKHGAHIESLAYVVGGRTVQKSDSPVPFDTTRIANGKYTVQVITTLADGQVIRESTVIEVDNAENFLSPFIRWVRANWSAVIRVGGVLMLLLVAYAAARLVRRHYLKKRERSFHGL